MTLVSVLVPTYDRPEYIEGAVETALGQTHDEIEVVIVCDPPSDDTRRVLESYADDDRVRPLYNDERRGISGSRNRALEYARGEFVCILDDDDRWAPTKVEKQLAVMADNPACGAVYTGGVAKRGGRTVDTYTPSLRGDIYPEILAGFDCKPYSGHMYRAECFETVGGYDTEFDCGEDWDLTIRVAREYEYEYVDEPLVVRQYHDRNVSELAAVEQREQLHRDLDEATDVCGRIWSKYRDDITSNPEIERRFRHGRQINSAWTELDQNNRRRALRYGLQATRHDPSVASLALCCFAVVGPSVVDHIRTVRDTVVDSRSRVADAGELQTVE